MLLNVSLQWTIVSLGSPILLITSDNTHKDYDNDHNK